MQLAIAVIGLLTALGPFLASIHQFWISRTREVVAVPTGATSANPTTPAAARSRKRGEWLLGAALTIFAATLLTAFVIVPRLQPGSPLAEVQSPEAGEKIGRPQDVEVRLNASIPEGTTVWLGYQNEKGGPFIIQASQCSKIEERLDCGPLYVGHDESDPAEFRIFVVTANISATAALSAHSNNEVVKPGDNISYARLPEGTELISEQPHITLR
jgi:hypothetical protein